MTVDEEGQVQPSGLEGSVVMKPASHTQGLRAEGGEEGLVGWALAPQTQPCPDSLVEAGQVQERESPEPVPTRLLRHAHEALLRADETERAGHWAQSPDEER